MNEDERKMAISRLVSKNTHVYEKAGTYPIDEDAVAAGYEYDVDTLREAFPHVLQVVIDADDQGQFATLRDGVSDEDDVVRFKGGVPKDTKGLIEALRAHYSSLVDTDSIADTKAKFAEIDENL